MLTRRTKKKTHYYYVYHLKYRLLPSFLNNKYVRAPGFYLLYCLLVYLQKKSTSLSWKRMPMKEEKKQLLKSDQFILKYSTLAVKKERKVIEFYVSSTMEIGDDLLERMWFLLIKQKTNRKKTAYHILSSAIFFLSTLLMAAFFFFFSFLLNFGEHERERYLVQCASTLLGNRFKTIILNAYIPYVYKLSRDEQEIVPFSHTHI